MPKIGHNIELLAKKRITKKRNVGDLMGLHRMNNTIKEMKMLSNPPQAKRRRHESVESNLWVSDVTDTDFLMYWMDSTWLNPVMYQKTQNLLYLPCQTETIL